MKSIYGTYTAWEIKRLNWFQARVYCNLTGGHLAAFETAAEYDAIRQQIPEAFPLFIGLNDHDVEGEWRWEHSGQLLGAYSSFSLYEPNGGLLENCIRIRNHTWADTPCNKPFQGFLCEYDN